MHKYFLLFTILFSILSAETLPIDTTHIEDSARSQDTTKLPWQKFTARIGGYISYVNSSIGLRSSTSSAKIVVDSEDMFRLSEMNSAFRLMLSGRIKQHHTFTFDMFRLSRTAESYLGAELTIGGEEYKIGTQLTTDYDLFFSKLVYTYSFYQNETVDLAAGVGLHYLSTELGFTRPNSSTNSSGRVNIPLPVINSTLSFTPREWVEFKSYFSYLYIKFDTLEGALFETTVLCDFKPWDHFGAGLGVSTIRFHGGFDNSDMFTEMDVNFDGIIFYLSTYL